MGLIAKVHWWPYGPKIPYLPDTLGFALKAGGAVTAGRFVVRAGDDGYFDMCGDNAVLVSGIAASTATAEGDVLKIIPCLPDMIYRVAYTGSSKTSLEAADIGNEFGMASDGTLDLDNTTNDLFTIVGYDNTNDWAYVTIDPTLIVGPGGIGSV